jgi:hypothetical protein
MKLTGSKIRDIVDLANHTRTAVEISIPGEANA